MKASSLRFRVALVFAIFGAALSIFFSGSLFWISTQIGHRLMDQTLHAELEDSVKGYASNPLFAAADTATMKVYVRSALRPHEVLPKEILALTPKDRNVEINTIDYRLLIADRDGARFYLLFDTENQHTNEKRLLHLLMKLSVLVILASTLIGFWLAFTIITPLTRLVQQITQAGQGEIALAQSGRADEIGELARAFASYQRRMSEFVERERYFTADISHELRTPLAVISGSLEVLEHDETLTPKQSERLRRIGRAKQDMVELSAGLLLMAREFQFASTAPLLDAGLILQQCVTKHEFLVRERPISIIVELIEEPALHVEQTLFEVLVANLLRNALFNTLSGKVVLSLEAQQLTVHDTGVGMSKEVMARAFERNFKGAGSEGSGVGLSLVKRICKRFGWLVSIESHEGQGTTVTVFFSGQAEHSNIAG
jgi:signal transduction histidine kinase